MKWQASELPSGEHPDVVALGLRTRFDVDEGTFETPDDLDGREIRRLEEAGHSRADADDAEPDTQGATDDDVEETVEQADDEPEDDADSVDDEYADMGRGDLYDVYKERGGPKSWNEVSGDQLRHDLRINDETGTFPTEEAN